MRGKSIQWLIVVSAISCLVWVGGLAWTLRDYFGDVAGLPAEKAFAAAVHPPANESKSPVTGAQSTPIPAAADASFRVVALGDSLTKGTGDPGGKGYVGYLLDDLMAATEQQVVADNYGVNGQTSTQLAELLQEAEVQSKIKAADAIVVSIGGNDLFGGRASVTDLNLTRIQEIQKAYLRELDAILKQLREANGDAAIFLIGLYNPFISGKDSAATTKIITDWNYGTAELAAGHPQTVLVPTFDLFQLDVHGYLAADLFHPNAAGYRLIGERVASLIAGQGVVG